MSTDTFSHGALLRIVPNRWRAGRVLIYAHATDATLVVTCAIPPVADPDNGVVVWRVEPRETYARDLGASLRQPARLPRRTKDGGQ